MKIETKIFAEALSKVAGVASKRAAAPIFNCVKLVAAYGRLELSATDIASYVIASCQCDTEVPIKACVNARILSGILGCIGPSLSVTQNATRISFDGLGHAAVGFLPVDEFPAPPSGCDKLHGVSCPDLADCIEAVAWAGDPNGDVPWNGLVSVDMEAKMLRATCTMGKNLARVERPLISAKGHFLIRCELSDLICGALREPAAVFSLSDNAVCSKSDAFTVYALQSEGPYLTQIDEWLKLPRPECGTVNLKEFSTAISGAEMLAKDKAYCPVLVSQTEAGMLVEFEDGDSSYSTTCCAGTSGANFRINTRLLNQVLSKFPNETAVMTLGKQDLMFTHGDYKFLVSLLNPVKPPQPQP